MIIKVPQSLANVQLQGDPSNYVAQTLSQVCNVLNGNVGLTDNCDANLIGVTFGIANHSYGFQHTLQFVPNGFFVVGINSAMIIFSSPTPNTSSLIYLQSNAAGSGKVLVF